MDLKEIQTLITFVSKAGVDEVEIEKKDFKLSIKKNPAQQGGMVTYTQAPAPVQQYTAAPVNNAPVQTPADTAPAASTDNLVTIKSPMIGTFYRAAGPDKPIFANVGDEIKPGKVVCIIEAMKLFNEIESEISGRIVKILVDNATPVEYDQPLFLVEPN
jgi:acetyl-CoA carboxylase biotin carboxyl carrier protein